MTKHVLELLRDQHRQEVILDRIVEAILDAQDDLQTAPAARWQAILAGAGRCRNGSRRCAMTPDIAISSSGE
jgi:hypothetical protein